MTQTNCDRVRIMALNGATYGAIISPAQITDEIYADVTQWLVVGGVHSGEILDTAGIIGLYPDYNDGCGDPPPPIECIYAAPYAIPYGCGEVDPPLEGIYVDPYVIPYV